MRVLLVTPPMTQLNTPYPATAYLTGFLRQHAARRGRGGAGGSVDRAVPAAVLARRADARCRPSSRRARRGRRRSRFDRGSCRAATTYVDTGRAGRALPPGPRPEPRAAHRRARVPARGAALRRARRRARRRRRSARLGVRRARRHRPRQHLASLYIDDLADVDPRRHRPALRAVALRREARGERARLRSAARRARRRRRRWSTGCSTSSRASCVARHRPDVVGLTVPFPGNVYGALRIARASKAERPATQRRARRRLRQHRAARARATRACSTTSTSSRSTTASAPLLALLEHLRDPTRPLFRTFVREAGAVVVKSTPALARRAHRDTGTPTYDGPAARSLPVAVRDAEPDAPAVVRRALEQADRRARLLLEEVHVLRRHARLHRALRAARRPTLLVDRIEALVARDRADRLPLRRRGGAAGGAARARRAADRAQRRRSPGGATSASRRRFTPELAQLLARSGCVAVSGGLEVASDRLLALMKKGVTVEQVARVTRAFTDAGIMVHAYLMYGFPTETAQETVDALERVRQLFAEGCIQSAFWHRFAATAHSPIGQRARRLRHPAARAPPPAGRRSRATSVAFDDPTGCDHERLRRRPAQGALQLHARRRARRGRAPLVRARGRTRSAARRRGKAGRLSRSRRSRRI